MRGGVPVFIDIRPDTMNMDKTHIEKAITEKTRVIVPVHYAGVATEMDVIMAIATKFDLLVIEDAAQGIMCNYKGKPLGSIGNLGALSFHETKNIHCGEGGALLINDQRFIERAEIIREKGTNRSKFFRGEVDKYTWVDIGSSYLPSDIVAAFLYAQMEQAAEITAKRMEIWNVYYDGLKPLADEGLIELPFIPADSVHNAHMFYIKTKSLAERTALIGYLKESGIHPVFHYIPLHSSEAGLKFSRFYGEDKFTSRESERLLRLPIYVNMSYENLSVIINKIRRFYEIN
jgi:dTDP-4-amino-4,6-dideoxygalactose transaminase